MAKQRLASMEAEALKVQADLKNDLEVEIETIERQVADNEREFNISEGVLGTLPATRAQFAKEANRVTYQIVRQTAAGPVGIESTGMTVLQPATSSTSSRANASRKRRRRLGPDLADGPEGGREIAGRTHRQGD